MANLVTQLTSLLIIRGSCRQERLTIERAANVSGIAKSRRG